MELPQANLEIEQDLAFQHRHWRRQRIGWVVIALILLAGFSGFFGHHPWARATSRSANGQLTIAYDRYGRYDSSAEFLITIKPDVGKDGMVALWFDAEYLDLMTITAVSPLPLRGEARAGQRAFIFQTDGNPFSAIFTVQPHTIGLVRGRAWVNEANPLPLTHLVWP